MDIKYTDKVQVAYRLENAAKFLLYKDAEDLANRLNSEAPNEYGYEVKPKFYWDKLDKHVTVIVVSHYDGWDFGFEKNPDLWIIGWVSEESEAVKGYEMESEADIRKGGWFRDELKSGKALARL